MGMAVPKLIPSSLLKMGWSGHTSLYFSQNSTKVGWKLSVKSWPASSNWGQCSNRYLHQFFIVKIGHQTEARRIGFLNFTSTLQTSMLIFKVAPGVLRISRVMSRQAFRWDRKHPATFTKRFALILPCQGQEGLFFFKIYYINIYIYSYIFT